MTIDGDRWRKSLRVGRWQISITLMRHQYAATTDRWVVQTYIVYARKP